MPTSRFFVCFRPFGGTVMRPFRARGQRRRETLLFSVPRCLAVSLSRCLAVSFSIPQCGTQRDADSYVRRCPRALKGRITVPPKGRKQTKKPFRQLCAHLCLKAPPLCPAMQDGRKASPLRGQRQRSGRRALWAIECVTNYDARFAAYIAFAPKGQRDAPTFGPPLTARQRDSEGPLAPFGPLCSFSSSPAKRDAKPKTKWDEARRPLSSSPAKRDAKPNRRGTATQDAKQAGRNI